MGGHGGLNYIILSLSEVWAVFLSFPYKWPPFISRYIVEIEVGIYSLMLHTVYFDSSKAGLTLNRDKINKASLLKARRKSEMLVALETCRQLHKAEELDEDLQPLFR